MMMLALEDMAGMTEPEVKAHIANEYAGEDSGFNYGEPTDDQKRQLALRLTGFDVLIAYESVGSYGCDSSSWFLLRSREDGSLHTISGGHCSCYGFEGQGEIEAESIEYLKSDKFYLPLGGYDESDGANMRAVKDYIAGIEAKASPVTANSR
jgi:hypothetical protein